jgi:hypothetical protein
MTNKKKIENDNNEIIENVMEVLDEAVSNKEQLFKFIIQDANGSHVEHKPREEYLEHLIYYAMETLSEHNYFYEKEGIDKYDGEDFIMKNNTINLKEDVYCPTCQTAHSIEAWEYRTRMEYNITNIDSEDIALMSEALEDYEYMDDYEYTCPTCSSTSYLFDIKRFQPVVEKAKPIIKKMLVEINGDTEHAQAFQLINGEDLEVYFENGHFSVKGIVDEIEFVTNTGSLEETYGYLLTFDIDFTKYQD